MLGVHLILGQEIFKPYFQLRKGSFLDKRGYNVTKWGVIKQEVSLEEADREAAATSRVVGGHWVNKFKAPVSTGKAPYPQQEALEKPLASWKALLNVSLQHNFSWHGFIVLNLLNQRKLEVTESQRLEAPRDFCGARRSRWSSNCVTFLSWRLIEYWSFVVCCKIKGMFDSMRGSG